MWLEGRGVRDKIRAALKPVLMKLWHAVWKLLGDDDQVAADRIARFAARWLDEVTDTRIRRISEILARGGSEDELIAAIKAVLESEQDGELIARTEATRAVNAAAMEAYRKAGVGKVEWKTRSANPCPICLMNEAAGPRYLGEPFPSGNVAPPEHPNCQCALIPAEGE